jgi:hypothetical protein
MFAVLLAIGLTGLVTVDVHAEIAAPDPLPSWNDGPTKRSIIDFVTAVTKEGGTD